MFWFLTTKISDNLTLYLDHGIYLQDDIATGELTKVTMSEPTMTKLDGLQRYLTYAS
jgi:hypothetical protein